MLMAQRGGKSRIQRKKRMLERTVAPTAVPAVSSVPWHLPAAEPSPPTPLGIKWAPCLASPGIKE